MSDFKSKMHQIQFRLGSAPDPGWGAYSALADLLARFKRAYFYETVGRVVVMEG